MVFNSIQFILFFMVAFLLSYLFIDIKYRNIIILLYSIVFYILNSINNPINIMVVIFIVLINYVILYLLFAYYDSKVMRLVFVCSSIFINIGLLLIFKLEIFAITLPIGYSFYVFHIISIMVDIDKYYSKYLFENRFPKYKTEFFEFLSYVVFFPKVLSGPIMRYDNFIKDFYENRILNINNFKDGFIQFSIGLGLKVLLSDNLYYVINQINIFGYNSISLPTAWIGVYVFTLRLYFDFAGYSLMAIGIAKVLCYNLPINFDLPFMAVSVTDFYRRWHITLMNFFKDYVYIPLGGNCNGNTLKQVRNLFVVWILTSLWHGLKLNYIMWGMSIFFIIALEKFFLLRIFNRYKIIGHIFILIFIPITFLFFSIENTKDLFCYIPRLFSFDSFSNITDFKEIFYDYYKIIFISILFITPLPKILYEKIIKLKYISLLIAIFIFILSIYFINILDADTFKYFSF